MRTLTVEAAGPLTAGPAPLVPDLASVPTDSSRPAVIVCLVLLVLFLITQSVRLVLPGERLVVRHGSAERVKGPGLACVVPFRDHTRTLRSPRGTEQHPRRIDPRRRHGDPPGDAPPRRRGILGLAHSRGPGRRVAA